MNIHTVWLVTTLVAMGAGCGEGEEFAINERVFELPSFELGSTGCSFHQLGESVASGHGGGKAGSPLAHSSAWEGDKLIHRITEGSRLLAERVYDEAFFRSGMSGELSGFGSSGKGLLIRIWTSVGPDGRPQCADFNDNGPPTAQ